MEPEEKRQITELVESLSFKSSKDLFELERLYLDDKERGHTTLTFQGKMIVTEFAKYIIYYVNSWSQFRNVKLSRL